MHLTCDCNKDQLYKSLNQMMYVPAFIDMPELVNHARMNHARWRELDEAGVTTLADVRRAQGRQNAITSANTTAEE